METGLLGVEEEQEGGGVVGGQAEFVQEDEGRGGWLEGGRSQDRGEDRGTLGGRKT